MAAFASMKTRQRVGNRASTENPSRRRQDLYKTWCGPTGKTCQRWGNPHHQKYSTLPKFGNRVCVAASRPNEEGRIAIVTNAGRAAVDVGHIG
ncbi:hypothetical protein RAD04_25360, partial [Bradyrhizobium sp. 25ACV]